MKRAAAVALIALASWTASAAGAPREANKQNVVEQARYSAAISNKWQQEIRARYGISSAEWTEQMIGTFSSADMENLKRAAAATSFDQMTGALFGGSSAANRNDVRPLQIGSIENDLVFTPLPPCRIVDTRVAGGTIAANGTRSFNGWTGTDFLTQGGAASNCGIPENASAVLANAVAVDTASRIGFLTVYPSGTARPNASTINFVGSDIANQIALKLCRPGCPDQFSVFSTSETHFVADVYGYYMEPVATALDCVVVTETGNLLGLGSANPVASCAAGYTATGGGCGTVLGLNVSASRPATNAQGRPTGWSCGITGGILGSLLGYRVDATCCRIPGR